jgi:transposase-like protein
LTKSIENVNISISTIYTIFKKHKINTQPQEVKEKYKTFKEYKIGYLHIDLFYAPLINGEKYYVFVAIDRATRTLFYQIYDKKTAKLRSTSRNPLKINKKLSKMLHIFLINV